MDGGCREGVTRLRSCFSSATCSQLSLSVLSGSLPTWSLSTSTISPAPSRPHQATRTQRRSSRTTSKVCPCLRWIPAPRATSPASESIPPLMIGGSLTTNRYPSHKAGGLFEDPIKLCLRQSAITDFHVFQLLRSALRRYIARPRRHPSERTTLDIPLPAMTSSI